MRNRSLFKRTLAIALAGILAFGNLSTAEAANVAGEGQTVEQNNREGEPQDIIYPEGKVVDGSATWNSTGGGAINIYDGYCTNVYFTNEPFIKTEDNWSSFIIETNVPEGGKGYTMRADNYGWSYPGNSPLPPEMTLETSENWDWDAYKEFSKGAVVVSAYKVDANTLRFFTRFSGGYTLTYTLTYEGGVPADLVFYVGADGGKITQNKITFTRTTTAPEPIKTITLDKQTANLERECVYDSQADLDGGKEPTTTINGSVDVAVSELKAENPESPCYEDVLWKVDDESKAKLKIKDGKTVTVSLTDAAAVGDEITVTAYAGMDPEVKAECKLTVVRKNIVEAKKVDAISVPDQELSVRYSDKATPVWDSVIIDPIISPDDADFKQVEYTTESDAVSIEGNKITGVKVGEAIVKATSKSTSKASCEFKVTMKEPEFGTLTNEFTANGFESSGSGFEKLTGDFDITYHFKNKSTDSTENWYNFVFELADGAGRFTTLRADAYAMGELHDGGSDLTWTGVPSDWDEFKDVVKDSEVTVGAKRTGNQVEVRYYIVGTEGKTYDMGVTVSSEEGFPEILYARITGEKVEVSDITLTDEVFTIPASKDDTYTYEPADAFQAVKPYLPVVFAVKTTKGYEVKKVSYGDTELTADEDGRYTIPPITDKTVGVTVETEKGQYPITYVVDGVAQTEKGQFSLDNVQNEKVALKAPGTINGWYATADDRTTKITDFTAAEYMTKDGITVYGYMPHKVTLSPATPSFSNGTIDAFDTTASYYIGDKVSISAAPKAGYTSNISVSYKDEEGTDKAVETKKEDKDGKEVISFIMPAADVTVTCAEFTGVDKSELETAINAAKAIYDGGNRNGDYTAESYGVFKDAYEKAVAAKNDAAATQLAVDTAKDTLASAQKDLKIVTKVKLNKSATTITVGRTDTLTATVTTEGEDKSVTWSTSNPAVAKVNGGVVTAVAAGTADITATAKDGTKAVCKVTVVKPNVTPKPTLKLNKTSVTLYTGKASKTITIKPTVTGASKTVAWTTSNKKVATVKNGKITAVGKGKATITAKANGITQTVKVTVKNPTITAKNGKKKVSSVSVKKNKKVTLTVSVSPKNSGSALTKLKSKEKKIASVTYKKGKLTIKGKKKGKITIKITSGKATKSIKVTVK